MNLPALAEWEHTLPRVFLHPFQLKRRLDSISADAYHVHCSVPLILWVRSQFRKQFYSDFNDIVLLRQLADGANNQNELTSDIFEMSDHWNRPLTATERNRLETIDAILPKQLTSILDVGCGDGRVTDRLATHAKVVVGSDRSAVALALHNNLRVMASLPSMPFGDRSFDLVSILEVLEHLDNATLRQSIQELARLCGRFILIGVPHRETLALRDIRCVRCHTVFNQIGHIQRFTQRRLRSLVPDFELIDFRTCGSDQRPYYQAMLLKLRQKWGGIYHRTPRSVCPNCHLALMPTELNEISSISFACNKINNRLRNWLPLARSHCLALYRRTTKR